MKKILIIAFVLCSVVSHAQKEKRSIDTVVCKHWDMHFTEDVPTYDTFKVEYIEFPHSEGAAIRIHYGYEVVTKSLFDRQDTSHINYCALYGYNVSVHGQNRTRYYTRFWKVIYPPLISLKYNWEKHER